MSWLQHLSKHELLAQLRSKPSLTALLFLVAVSLILGIFFRIQDLPNRTWFFADQASDLLIARAIVENGHRPLIGPVLGVQNFFTPPSYYYLLAAFFFFIRQAEWVALFFLVFNFIGMGLLFKLAQNLKDTKLGLITIVLFALSCEQREHARSMWQPHLVPFFIILALYFLERAQTKKSTWKLVVAIFSYFFAFSIYPSPILLLPFFLYHTFTFFVKKSDNKIRALFLTGTLFAVASLSWFWSLLLFEYKNGYPTFNALFKGDSASSSYFGFNSLVSTFSLLIENLNLFWARMTGAIGFPIFFESFWIQSLVLFSFVSCCGIFLYLRKSTSLKHTHKFFSFISPLTLALGCLFLIIFQGTPYSHRLVALVPFYLLVIAFIIDQIEAISHQVVKYFAIALTFSFILLNVAALTRDASAPPEPRSFATHAANAQSVIKDLKTNQVPINRTVIRLITPEDDWSYFSTPYVWFALEELGYNYQVTPSGNDIVRWGELPADTAYIYLICLDFPTTTNIQVDCANKITQFNSDFTLKESRILNDKHTIFVFEKQPSS